MTFDPEILSQPVNAKVATRVVQELGELARYWCKSEVLSAAGIQQENRPKLPRAIGACAALIGVKDDKWQQYLVPGLVLPLQWKEGDLDHDPKLPPEMIECAKQVLSAFPVVSTEDQEQEGESPKKLNYYLSFWQNDEDPWPDLSGMTADYLEAKSAFGSLAGGLEGCRSNTNQKAGVLASAVWNDEFMPVGRLQEKLSCAADFGIDEVFVASDQKELNGQPSAEMNFGGRKLTLYAFSPCQNGNPRQGMNHYFLNSALEPSPDDPKLCFAFHDRVRNYDEAFANSYYKRVLAKHVINIIRTSMLGTKSILSQPQFTHFVTIATHTTGPVPVLVEALRIKKVLVLHTPDLSESANSIKTTCQKIPGVETVTLCETRYETGAPKCMTDFTSAAKKAFEAFVESEAPNPGAIVFDIDRGLTWHKLELISKIVAPENGLVIMTYPTRVGNFINHGTEQVFLWTLQDGTQDGFARIGSQLTALETASNRTSSMSAD